MRLTILLLVTLVWLTIQPSVWGFSFYEELTPATDFVSSQWENIQDPLTLGDLHGQFVLLQFWSSSSLESLELVPQINKLFETLQGQLTVVGVHSGRFSFEKETTMFRSVVRRYGIEYPVMQDENLAMWKAYGIHRWPSFVLIGPTGRVITKASGHDSLESVLSVFDDAKVYYTDRDLFLPQAITSTSFKLPYSFLSYPSFISTNDDKTLIAISDSGHHRLLVTTLSGEILHMIGSGRKGLEDGTFSESSFLDPKGLCFVGNKLYVADFDAPYIRCVDFDEKRVSTIFSYQNLEMTASPNRQLFPLKGITSLVHYKDHLYLSSASQHRIYRFSLVTLELVSFAGSGFHNLLDEAAPLAQLAQPGALSISRGRLYFIDSSSSSLRWVSLTTPEVVHTMVGKGLFVFGDTDGVSSEVRLQYPQGLGLDYPYAYLADTYNSKIKQFNLATLEMVSLETDKTRYVSDDGSISGFNMPSSVSRINNKLFITDTYNHRVRIYDLKTNQVSNFELVL